MPVLEAILIMATDSVPKALEALTISKTKELKGVRTARPDADDEIADFLRRQRSVTP